MSFLTPAFIHDFVKRALAEDRGTGDHTSLACVREGTVDKAQYLLKQEGIASGIKAAGLIWKAIDPQIIYIPLVNDGEKYDKGTLLAKVEGDARNILTGERLVLNILQRMGGIATLTHQYCERVKHTKARILDTRKTTPLFRAFEKEAVITGGGKNHRFGLYDMIMIKDNHISYAGGITNALEKVKEYLKRENLQLPIEIETKNLKEVKEVLEQGGVNRIMLDNFTVEAAAEAIQFIEARVETEISGGINLETVTQYAETDVDFISVGALTHSAPSLDISMKAIR